MRSRPEAAPLKPPLRCNASYRITPRCTTRNALFYRRERGGICATRICRVSDFTRLSKHNDKLAATINFATLNGRGNLF
jgi:hypothetical protein